MTDINGICGAIMLRVFKRVASAGILGLTVLASATLADDPRIELIGGAAHPFSITGSDRDGFTFAASSAGPIHVAVDDKSAAVTVVLVQIGGRRISKTGMGAFSIDDAVTPADLANGHIWGVSISPQFPSQQFTPVATGTIAVAHPAGVSTLVDAQVATLKKPAAPARKASPDSAQRLAQTRAKLAQEASSRHLQQVGAIKSQLPPEVASVLTQRATLLGQGRPVNETLTAAPAPVMAAIKTSGFVPPTGKVAGLGAPAGPHISGTADPNSPPPGNLVPPDPTVIAYSTQNGDPGTPVLITGTNLRGTAGEVHFIVANGRDIAAPITRWTDTQIVTEVPYVDGVGEYNGYVYTITADGKSTPMIAFHFVPVMDVADLGYSMKPVSTWWEADDAKVDPTSDPELARDAQYNPLGTISRTTGILGHRGDDEFYLTRTLANGWKVTSCNMIVYYMTDNDEDSYVTMCNTGSSSPHTKVHWWMDMEDEMTTQLDIQITGPKGLSY